jgi:hypothetical protein
MKATFGISGTSDIEIKSSIGTTTLLVVSKHQNIRCADSERIFFAVKQTSAPVKFLNLTNII